MSVVSSGRSATVTSGSTNYVGSGQVTSGDVVYGVNGGTDHPAVDLASGGIISGASALSGGVVAAAANGTTYGGTAYDSGSFAALNQGVVISATITSRAGLAVGNLSGYQGSAARAIAPHVMSGGQAIVGGGFTVKGQSFSGSGVISGGTFDVGSTEQLASGGTDSGSIFAGTQIVSAGATALQSIFSAGVQLVQGGLASGSVVSAGGTVVATGGGSVSGVTVGSGGTALTLSGGVMLNQVVLARGVAIVSSGGSVGGVTVSSGGSEIVSSGGFVSGATILSGGTGIVQSGASILTVAISAGGSMIVASGATVVGLAIGAAATSTGPVGKLIVTPGATLSDISVGWRGRIDIEGLAYKTGGKIAISNNILTVSYPDGSSWSTPLSGTYKAGDFHLEADSDGSTDLVYDKCFLAGTMIRTPEGERAVEDLREGDMVLVREGEGLSLRRIVWTGSAEIEVDPSRSDDIAGYPVRFRANALGPSIPDRDLYITPEHCVFVDNALVPARMLVNGDSIAYDRSQSRFRIHHFRTEEHEVIWSNNMTTETLLGDGAGLGLSSDAQTREDERATDPVANPADESGVAAAVDGVAKPYAAPLCVSRDFVEPIHRRLAERAGRILAETSAMAFDQDPDLHLALEDGRIIRPVRRVDDMMIFQVPASFEEVRIRSRAAAPASVEGPFVDDRRNLGVLVGDVHLWDSSGMTSLSAHLSDESLDGWHRVEPGPGRWTGGNARLRLGQRLPDAPAILGISIKATARYGIAAP